jgi:hypothetical protein
VYEFHRVFTHWTDDLWVGVNWAVRHAKLTPANKYVTVSVAAQKDICLVLPDGRIVCDYGPDHLHEGEPYLGDDTAYRRQKELTDGGP